MQNCDGFHFVPGSCYKSTDSGKSWKKFGKNPSKGYFLLLNTKETTITSYIPDRRSKLGRITTLENSDLADF